MSITPKVVGDVLKELLRWAPLAFQLKDIFGGDKRAALQGLRKLELEERAKRDDRMGR